MTLRKVGGLWHWRIGRIGGSFYVARRRKVTPMVTFDVSMT